MLCPTQFYTIIPLQILSLTLTVLRVAVLTQGLVAAPHYNFSIVRLCHASVMPILFSPDVSCGIH